MKHQIVHLITATGDPPKVYHSVARLLSQGVSHCATPYIPIIGMKKKGSPAWRRASLQRIINWLAGFPRLSGTAWQVQELFQLKSLIVFWQFLYAPNIGTG
jgi:hypothetical protein